MTVLNDRQIKELVRIEPFTDPKVSAGLSYGLGSFGYDVRAGNELKIFTNVNTVGVDPKAFDEKCFVSVTTDDPVWIPPNSFLLCASLEHVYVPDDCTVIVLGKSTYARCGVVCIATPLEAGWNGNVVLEFANTTPLPVRFYPNEGCAQLVFFRGERPNKTYADLGGKYQGQTGVQLPKMSEDIVSKRLAASPITEQAVRQVMANADRSGESKLVMAVKPVDQEAPYGRKKDGTPKKRPGPSGPTAAPVAAATHLPMALLVTAKGDNTANDAGRYGEAVHKPHPTITGETIELRSSLLPPPGKPPAELLAEAFVAADQVDAREQARKMALRLKLNAALNACRQGSISSEMAAAIAAADESQTSAIPTPPFTPNNDPTILLPTWADNLNCILLETTSEDIAACNYTYQVVRDASIEPVGTAPWDMLKYVQAKELLAQLGCRVPTVGEYLSKIVPPVGPKVPVGLSEIPSWLTNESNGIHVRSAAGHARLSHSTRAMVGSPVFTVTDDEHPELYAALTGGKAIADKPFALTAGKFVRATSLSYAGPLRTFLNTGWLQITPPTSNRIDTTDLRDPMLELPLLHELIGFLKTGALWNSSHRSVWFNQVMVPMTLVPYLCLQSGGCAKFMKIDYFGNNSRGTVIDDKQLFASKELGVSVLTVNRVGPPPPLSPKDLL